MPANDSEKQERLETIEELSELLQVVQEMGRRLSNETHGNAYDLVQELNGLLHQARQQINLIDGNSRNP
jgi:hypothetical protein